MTSTCIFVLNRYTDVTSTCIFVLNRYTDVTTTCIFVPLVYLFSKTLIFPILWLRWRLFQKHVICANFDNYDFITVTSTYVNIPMLERCSDLSMLKVCLYGQICVWNSWTGKSDHSNTHLRIQVTKLRVHKVKLFYFSCLYIIKF